MNTFRYGDADGQVADLHLPGVPAPPVVCILHGGFWRMPYGREETTAIAADLAARGYAAWNIEYRRVGAPGGGWPGTLDDVLAAIDCLAGVAGQGDGLDLSRVAVAGHSAGGQLALWACAEKRRGAAPGKVVPVAAAALAPVADLHRACELGCGNGAVAAFLGDTPDEIPERYAFASPLRRAPLGVRQLVVHGALDEALPAELSRAYARCARDAGDEVEHVEIPGMGHMEFLDPASRAHATLCDWLGRVLA